MNIVSQLLEDLRFYAKAQHHEFVPSALLDRLYWACASYRLCAWARRVRIPVLGWIVRHTCAFISLVASTINGTDISSAAIIGQRFYIHNSFGLTIAEEVVVGNDCTVFTGVCLVYKANGRNQARPVIGNRVTLGVGCKVIGPVVVGDDVVIGANAVVLRDVPAGHIAVGIPAIVKERSDKTIRRSSDDNILSEEEVNDSSHCILL